VRSTDPRSSVFESTIRYIGGLLSAYELGGKENQFLVDKAKQLADGLSVAWTQVGIMAFRRDSTRFNFFF
jgi:mannosyl-oligosaccharide alpha-1,2-mannosidase